MYKITYLDGNKREFESLRDADLRGAYLRDADLRDADLRGAYLIGADLEGVDLRGADLYNTSIITFQGGKHFAFYHEGDLQVGCEYHSLEHWINNVDGIGRNNDYSDLEIERYKRFIKIINEED